MKYDGVQGTALSGLVMRSISWVVLLSPSVTAAAHALQIMKPMSVAL